MVEQATKKQNDIENNSNIKIYDFKKALRLSTEHIRGLSKIHENFAYRLSSTLSGQMRSIIHVDLLAVEQLPYEDYINQLPNRTILSVLDSEAGQEFRMVIHLEQPFAFNLMDRLLGGKGLQNEEPRASLTPIQINVLKGILEGLHQTISKSWVDVAQFKLKVLDLKTDPQFLQLTSPDEMVIVIRLQVMFGNKNEKIEICIPYNFIEPLTGKLLSYNTYGNGQIKKTSEGNELIQEKIEYLTVPVSVELGRAAISIEELLGLSVNDVLQLDQMADEPLKVRINEQVKFLAHPGTKKSKIAIKIEHVVEGEDNHE